MEFQEKYLKDPEIYQVNRLSARSDHKFYRDREEMELGASSFCYPLNGLWYFHYGDNRSQCIDGFEASSYDCRNWRQIRVPGHIQTQGYDRCQYVNTNYPWDGREQLTPGQLPEAFNPVASYVRYVKLPASMAGGRMFISFQGVESAFALWVNGAFVGYGEDSFTPSEFELTSFLRDGENKIAVQVYKWCSGSWLEDQDFFRFSGIFRDVYLYQTPAVHVWDLKVAAELSDGFDHGRLTVTAGMLGRGGGRLKLFVYGPDGAETAEAGACLAAGDCTAAGAEKRLADGDCISAEAWISADASAAPDGAPVSATDGEIFGRNPVEGTGELVVEIPSPKLWSSEHPELYHLVLEVFDGSGNLMEVISQNAGFRRFEISGGLMLLNGKRIVFKGVDRHEFNCVAGRAVTKEDMIADVAAMKRNNINAVRTSHYPNQSYFYELCDEYGIYMIDEANLETHGTWQNWDASTGACILPDDKEEWLNLMKDRAMSMIQRDKNHPSVLIWSCGNESYGGKDLYEMSQFMRSLDPDRLVHYEGIDHDRRYNGTSDMESQMYTSVEGIKSFLSVHRDKPLILCEYAHAMGTSTGALFKYTELTREEPLYQGGFLWDFLDQSILRKDRYGSPYFAYGGDFGDRPTDYNFCGNGLLFADRRETPKMAEVKYCYQEFRIEAFPDHAAVYNESLFTNTDEYLCVVTVERDGVLIERAGRTVSIAPGERGEIGYPTIDFQTPGNYAVTVSFQTRTDVPWAAAGHEVAFGQYARSVEGKREEENQPLEIIDSDVHIGVKGDNFHVMFSRVKGGIVSYQYGGRELLASSVPKPNFWRAPTDNDIGNHMAFRYYQWKTASLYLEKTSVTYEKAADHARVDCAYRLPGMETVSCLVSYQVYGSGKIHVTLDYQGSREIPPMPEFGMLFKLPADYDQLVWYGRGPQDNYCDRRGGYKTGLYRGRAGLEMVPYLRPQECGNKTGVKYMAVTDQEGRGLVFFTGDEMNANVLPYTPHEVENASHHYELPPVYQTVVRVSFNQMGVGGDNTWGARTHEEFLIPGDRKLEFSFWFQGI